jgi:hypothetical protein
MSGQAQSGGAVSVHAVEVVSGSAAEVEAA